MSRTRKSPPVRGSAEQGISAMELLIAFTILGIVTAVGVPQVTTLRAIHQQRDQVEQFELDVNYAKTTATAEGARGIVALTAGANTYTFGLDYPPYSNPAVADQVLFIRPLPGDGTLLFSRTLIFDSRGFLVDAFGDLVSASIDFQWDGAGYATATILPTGVLQFN